MRNKELYTVPVLFLILKWETDLFGAMYNTITLLMCVYTVIPALFSLKPVMMI